MHPRSRPNWNWVRSLRMHVIWAFFRPKSGLVPGVVDSMKFQGSEEQVDSLVGSWLEVTAMLNNDRVGYRYDYSHYSHSIPIIYLATGRLYDILMAVAGPSNVSTVEGQNHHAISKAGVCCQSISSHDLHDGCCYHSTSLSCRTSTLSPCLPGVANPHRIALRF